MNIAMPNNSTGIMG